VSLDAARGDQSLDKVVRLGANRAIFILGKYYAKLDDCEVYSIATSVYFSPFVIYLPITHFASAVLTPTLTYKWFKKNPGWPEGWKSIPLRKVRERWAETYKPKPPVKKATATPTAPVGSLNVRIFFVTCGSLASPL
jgi:hypothetical protein